LSGGTWTTQNKVRPGVYVKVSSDPQPLGTVGDRGIATMALPLSWGPAKTVIQVEAGADIKDALGYDITDAEMLLVREALKRAKTLLLYRLNEGTKASATIGTLSVTAKYGGVRGNDITLVIQQNIDDDTLFDVKTLVGGREVDFQTATDASGLSSNNWVTFGSGSLTATAGTALTGGNNGAVTNADHTDYLAAIELFDFQTMALVSDDATLKSVYVSFTKRLRDEEGKMIQTVVANYPLADYEGVISVKNGVLLSNGTTLSAAQATAWVAGATAGAQMNQSLTYQAYDDAVDAVPRYSNSQIEAAIKSGEFLFTQNNGRAVVETDINTFTSYTPEKRRHFSKNRVMRVLDGIANDFKRIFETFYIGRGDNDDDGRNLYRNECNTYMVNLQGIRAIQNFDSQKDVVVFPGEEADAVYVGAYVHPVDSPEKFYFDVKVR
jgi:Phage tail sheath protein.